MPSKLGKLLKKAMVISVEDQVTYCNRTVQVGPHVMVVECATLDVSVPRLRSKHREWTLKHGGHTIWGCTPSLSSYLVASKVAERRRVLELGAGIGVCGLIAHKTGASAVVMTDGDDSVIPKIQQNILVNVGMSGEEKVDEAKVEMEEGEVRPAHARHLRWGNAEEVRELMQDLETGYFDVVLGSDLIYPQDVKKAQALAGMDVMARDLFVTAAAALREGGVFLLAHEFRDNLEETVQVISKQATAKGFGPPQVVKLEENRAVLLLELTGKTSASGEKNEGSDDAEAGWAELISVLNAVGIGSAKTK